MNSNFIQIRLFFLRRNRIVHVLNQYVSKGTDNISTQAVLRNGTDELAVDLRIIFVKIID